jgi:hypothetical protein
MGGGRNDAPVAINLWFKLVTGVTIQKREAPVAATHSVVVV